MQTHGQPPQALIESMGGANPFEFMNQFAAPNLDEPINKESNKDGKAPNTSSNST